MFFKLKLLSINLISGLLLIFFLCLGSQNLNKRHSINLLINETVELPSGFLIGISFAIGYICGGVTATMMTKNDLTDQV